MRRRAAAAARRARRSGAGRCPRRGAGPSSASRWPDPRGATAVRAAMPEPRVSTAASQASGVRQRLGRPAGAAAGQPAVRAWADAGIVAIAPVDEVVPALGAGAGVVGDLVGRRGRRRRRSPGSRGTCRRRASGVGQAAQPAARGKVAEAGAGLDRELVEREVVDGQRERAAELGSPVGEGLALAGVDQVEADPREDRRGRPRRRATASAVSCSRPSARRSASFSACTPIERRLTPASR